MTTELNITDERWKHILVEWAKKSLWSKWASPDQDELPELDISPSVMFGDHGPVHTASLGILQGSRYHELFDHPECEGTPYHLEEKLRELVAIAFNHGYRLSENDGFREGQMH